MNPLDANREDFEPHLNQRFVMSSDAVGFEAELIEVSPVGETVGPTGRHAFSLVFRGPHTEQPRQQMYFVDREGLETFSLFLVPIGPDELGMKYEAVFT